VPRFQRNMKYVSEIRLLDRSPRVGSTPSHTDWLTVSRKLTSTSTIVLEALIFACVYFVFVLPCVARGLFNRTGHMSKKSLRLSARFKFQGWLILIKNRPENLIHEVEEERKISYFWFSEYRKHFKKCFCGIKCGWCVELTSLPPSMSRLSRQCGILNISQPYMPPWPVTEIVFLF
jgi:hypothetical protein